MEGVVNATTYPVEAEPLHKSSSEMEKYDVDAMRSELSKYVEDLQHKKDSEGNPLIRVPENFETIVGSMNREDLENSEAKPWSQYLLLESLSAQDGDDEYEGRYRNALPDEDEVKIQKGLARIKLLDRQLHDAVRRESLTTPIGHAASGDTGTAADLNDKTFMTRLHSAEDKNHTQEYSPSSQVIEGNLKKKSTSSDQPSAQRDAGLTAQEQERIESLLDGSAEGDADFTRHAYREFLEESKQIDEQLQEYGRLDRLDQFDESSSESPVTCSLKDDANSMANRKAQKNKSSNHLQQQREERQERKHAAKIDRLLKRLSEQPIDYEALVTNSSKPPPPPSRNSVATQSSSGTFDVPEISEVKVNRAITADTIRELIIETTKSLSASRLCTPALFAASADIEISTEADCCSPNEDMLNSARDLNCEEYSFVESRDKIEAVVQQFASDIEALKCVRNRRDVRLTRDRDSLDPHHATKSELVAETSISSCTADPVADDVYVSRKDNRIKHHIAQAQILEKLNQAIANSINENGVSEEEHSELYPPELSQLNFSDLAPVTEINADHPAIQDQNHIVPGSSSFLWPLSASIKSIDKNYKAADPTEVHSTLSYSNAFSEGTKDSFFTRMRHGQQSAMGEGGPSNASNFTQNSEASVRVEHIMRQQRARNVLENRYESYSTQVDSSVDGNLLEESSKTIRI